MTTTTTTTTTITMRAQSQGVGRDDERMGFHGGCKKEKGGDGEPAKMLFCIVVGVLLLTKELNIKTAHV